MPDDPNAVTPPADPQKPAKPDDAPKKLELTEDELEQRIAARLAEADRKAAAKAAKEKADADRKAAEEQGKHKELADAERQRADALAAEVRTLRVDKQLRDHLAAEHKGYEDAAKWIAPHVPADAEGDDLSAAIKAAAAEYVKANPRAKPTTAGVGAPPAGGVRAAAPRNPVAAQQARPAPRFRTLTYRG